jgi:hypothetical protein
LTCSASKSNFSHAITKTIQLNVQCKSMYEHVYFFCIVFIFFL